MLPALSEAERAFFAKCVGERSNRETASPFALPFRASAGRSDGLQPIETQPSTAAL